MCGAAVRGHDQFCPDCGTDLRVTAAQLRDLEETDWNRSEVWILVLVVLVVGLIITMVWMTIL
jgi:hypothetical protein